MAGTLQMQYFITIFCIAVPILHFLEPSPWRRFTGVRLINFSFRSLGRSTRELILLSLFFLVLNFLIDFKNYWFIYGVCSLVVAIRWGFRMTLITNLILFALSYLIPLLLQAGNVHFLQLSSDLISVHIWHECHVPCIYSDRPRRC